MKKYIDQAKASVQAAKTNLTEKLESSISMVREKVNGLPIIMSLEKDSKSVSSYDEKHYFVIPYKISDTGFALHTMRSLPGNTSEINNLPKRRVFHFANEQAQFELEYHLKEVTREHALTAQGEKVSALEDLANTIDALDKKLTYGMLLVGGIAAIFNPLVGVGIAAKAVMPSVSGLLTKYGLRPVGEKMTKAQLANEVKAAEKHIDQQFKEGDTLKVINPILQELNLALNTTAQEHDPLVDPNLADGNIPELSNERWRELTETALFHIYKEVVDDERQHAQANLGPEDIRWLNTMFKHRT